MKKNNLIPIVLGIVSIILTVAAYLILPDMVKTQLSTDGDFTTKPKLIAIAIPALLGIGGAIADLIANYKEERPGKGMLFSILGISVYIIMLFVNLR